MNFKRYIGREDTFQTSVAKLMDANTNLWFHVANERKTKTKINKRGHKTSLEGAILKAKGVKAGLPDVICLQPNRHYNGFVMELKVYPNKTTDAQETWLKRFREMNYKIVVTDSLDEAIEEIETYFKTI